MKEDKPLVSIITTCLNAEDTIEKTIESVLNQTYDNIEYIIIDGGSTDGTTDIIQKYEDRIDYWLSEKDSGISEGFNKGIRKATGELVGILNSDDWYEKNTVEEVVRAYKKCNADFYIGALRYWTEKGNSFIVDPDPDFKDKLDYRMPNVNHPTVFVKKSVYDELGLFNEGLRYAMDYDFLLRVMKAGKEACIINKVLANMRLGGNASKNAFQAYKEVASVAPSKAKAYFWLIYSTFKLILRKILEELGLNPLLQLLREKRYRK